MKNKVIISCIIFILLLLGIVFANSYVQALTQEQNNKIIEEANYNCPRIEEKAINCYNYCEQNDRHCIRRNNHCRRDCM